MQPMKENSEHVDDQREKKVKSGKSVALSGMALGDMEKYH